MCAESFQIKGFFVSVHEFVEKLRILRDSYDFLNVIELSSPFFFSASQINF